MPLEPLNLALLAACAIVALPVAIFAVECWLSLLPRRTLTVDATAPRPRTVVLIPAHNEAAVIERTLRTLLPTFGPDDRALVVADNCTDRTAEIARSLGAVAVERHDFERRGKGYALDFGMQTLAAWQAPPEVVLILDADCRVAPQTVETLARAAVATGRPAQALNLCDPGIDADAASAVSGLGIRFKNLVRPAGLAAVGMPCHLMGTGMALPWELARSARLATGQIVEDMNLGLELALAGRPALFVPEAEVTSPLPGSDAAFLSQRTRWEHGHLATSLALAPRLAWQALVQFRLDLAALAIDLLVPPFSLAIGAWAVAMISVLVAGWCGASWIPAIVLGSVGSLALSGVGLAWAVYCREAIPLSAFAGLPFYFARKLPIYASFFTRPQTAWVRTERK